MLRRRTDGRVPGGGEARPGAWEQGWQGAEMFGGVWGRGGSAGRSLIRGRGRPAGRGLGTRRLLDGAAPRPAGRSGWGGECHEPNVKLRFRTRDFLFTSITNLLYHSGG